MSEANPISSQETSGPESVQESLQRKAQDLSRSNDDLKQFAYVASHDLQEPIRMVVRYSQLLEKHLKGKLDAQSSEYLNFVVDGANRMQNLISDLLAYSVVDTRLEPLVKINAEKIFQHAMKNLQLAIAESSAEIICDSLPPVWANPVQLTQLFQNLVGNSVKFRRDKHPKIHIRAQHKDNEWLFSIQDNGIGLDEQYAKRIFEIVQRLHTREEYPGTGISLAICKKIVERHGGRIWVKSILSEGATFYFTIPVKNAGHD